MDGEAQNDVAQAGYRALRIEDLPQDLKPRERLKKAGAKNVSDDVLLAVILRVGVVGANAVETAKRLLVAFGSLDALASASAREIVARKIPGIGEAKALQIVAAMELGRRCSYLSLMKMKDGGDKFVRTTEDAYDLLLPLALRQLTVAQDEVEEATGVDFFGTTWESKSEEGRVRKCGCRVVCGLLCCCFVNEIG